MFKGISDEVIQVLLQPTRDGTKKFCHNKINLWTAFCDQLVIDYIQSTVNDALNFLYLLEAKSLSYIIVNSSRSALSAITLEGLERTVCSYVNKPPRDNPFFVKIYLYLGYTYCN